MDIRKITVQEIIDCLMKVEDKTLPFEVSVYGTDGFSLDYDEINLIEYENTNGTDSDVAINVHLTEIEQGNKK